MPIPRYSYLLAALLTVAGAAPSQAATEVRVTDGHARVPFDVRSGHVWVRGAIGRSDSLWIVVDTGASSSALDVGVAHAAGLTTHGEHRTFGAGGADSSTSVSNVTIAFSGVTIHRDETDASDFGALSALGGRPMQAIVGAELFQSCVVRLDYAGGMMDVWDAAHAPRALPGVVVPLTFESNHPYVEGVVTVANRPPLRGRFVIDTGSNGALILAPDAAARIGLPGAFPRTLPVLGLGVGGEVHNQIGRLESFAIGGLRFDHPVAVVPDSMGGHISAAGTLGNIGGQLLNRCAVNFDYAHQRVGFEPGAGFKEPFEGDMLGATMIRRGPGYLVRFVSPDSPAADGGLREGDVVVAIDGTPCTAIDPGTMRRLLQRVGQSVRLDVRRGDETRSVNVVLRRLI